MIKCFYKLFFIAALFLASCSSQEKSSELDLLIDNAIKYAQEKLINSIEYINNCDTIYPSETDSTGKWVIKGHAFKANWWTSGYFPACYWTMYQLTKNEKWKDYAKKWTEGLDSIQYNDWLPDMSGMIYFSYGNGYKYGQDSSYIKVLSTAANNYCNNFYNPTLGAIKCWGSDWSKQDFAIVTDFLVFNEFLFSAYQLTGEKRYYDIITSHIAKTMEHNFREDSSTWQFVNLDSTGVPLNYISEVKPYQGMKGGTRWSRAQAWAINGMTQAYRYTRKQEYLDAVKKLADYYIDNLPDDLVPPSDFDGPDDAENGKDASAAAIACSGLLELADYTGDDKYKQCALNTLRTLCSPEYLTFNDTSYSSILKRSQIIHAESEKGLIYADYYFLEAIAKYKGVYKYFMPGQGIIKE